MPIQPTYPGVYVQEVSSGVRTITGVSTSIAAFVGMVNRGRVNIPTRVLSFTDYERKYGSDTTVSEMTDQVRQFFFNGGQQAFIMRIANGATTSEVTVRNERDTDDVLVFTAKEAGELRYDPCRDRLRHGPGRSLLQRALRCHASDGQGADRGGAEVFNGLTMIPAAAVTRSMSLPSSQISPRSCRRPLPRRWLGGYAPAGDVCRCADFRTEIQAATWRRMAAWRAHGTLHLGRWQSGGGRERDEAQCAGDPVADFMGPHKALAVG
jgi:hypothetical protein